MILQSLRVPEWIISGPAETGKTFACLHLLDQLARAYAGSQWAIVRKVRADMDGTVLQTYETHFLRDDVRKFGGSKPERYIYPNDAMIWVGGMDRPGKVLSSERDGVYVNQVEELSLSDWETITTRTTGRAGHVNFGGMTFGDCNPGAASHWILKRESLKLLYSRHEDNPRLYDASGALTARGTRSMQILDALTGVRKERLRHGRWVNVEGAVYDLDPVLHEIDAFPIPAEWQRYRVIDFGYTNPFVCQWWAVDGDGRMYLYREIYMTQRTVRVHAARINALSGDERYVFTISDHDAEDRATLDECGIPTVPADKEISPGIQDVQERLKVAGDGRPRLFLVRGALVERDGRLAEAHKPVCTREEFDVYIWPHAQDGKAIKEIPVKDNDHGMDAARYMARFLKTGGSGLWYWEQ